SEVHCTGALRVTVHSAILDSIFLIAYSMVDGLNRQKVCLNSLHSALPIGCRKPLKSTAGVAVRFRSC
uniref:hypothetical protein n=1 Tax=Paenibacillus gorillae TaxID=1243662 RepID=UPI001EE2001E